jgi:hypothetical protein
MRDRPCLPRRGLRLLAAPGSELPGKAERVSGRRARAVRGRGRPVLQEVWQWPGRLPVVRVLLERRRVLQVLQLVAAQLATAQLAAASRECRRWQVAVESVVLGVLQLGAAECRRLVRVPARRGRKRSLPRM